MEIISESFLYFIAGYLLVLLVGALHTVFNVHVMRLPARDGEKMGEAYIRTRRYHPIYNLILFSYVGWLFMRAMPYSTGILGIWTGVIWTLMAAVLDLVLAVLIHHPFRQSFREFYINYQPWLGLSYLAILIGPLIGYVFVR